MAICLYCGKSIDICADTVCLKEQSEPAFGGLNAIIGEPNQDRSAKEILKDYENTTSHYADQEYSEERIILAMEEYSDQYKKKLELQEKELVNITGVLNALTNRANSLLDENNKALKGWSGDSWKVIAWLGQWRDRLPIEAIHQLQDVCGLKE